MNESEKWKWSHSVVSNSATPWTTAYQVPPSMGFSRQECWSGLPLPSPLGRRWAGFCLESFSSIKALLNPCLQPLQSVSTGSQKEGLTKNRYRMNIVNVEFQWLLANLASVVGPVIYKHIWGCSWVVWLCKSRMKRQPLKMFHSYQLSPVSKFWNFLKIWMGS